MDKEKFNIIYKNFAKPISEMKMTYTNSVMTERMVNSKVVKCFEELMKALNEQLNMYR